MVAAGKAQQPRSGDSI